MKTILTGILAAGMFTVASAEDEKMNLKWGGDFRYRNEIKGKEGDSPLRIRQRIKAKIGVKATKDDVWHFGLQLSTGVSDPVSTNQTLSGDFTTGDFGIGLAYIKFKSDAVDVTFGKFKNPLKKALKNELLWDGDLSPEGSALGLNFGEKKGKVNFTAGAFILTENKKDDETWLQVNQLSYSSKMENMKYMVSVGYSDYHNTHVPVAGDLSGNRGFEDGTYASDFNLLDFGLEFGTKLGGIPMTLGGAYVMNLGADENNTGFHAGLKLGKAKKPGSIQAGFSYKMVEADAVLGSFTDSDFNGGGTQGEGFEINAKYKVTKEVSVALTQFLTSTIDADNSMKYATQLDLNYKF